MKNFQRSLLVSSAIILVSVGTASAAFYYLSGDMSAKADRIITDQTLITTRSAAVASLAQLKHDAPVAAAYTDAIHKLLPTHDDLIAFPGWVTALGQTNNVTVTVIFTGNNMAATVNTPGTDGFSLSASGAVSDLVAFAKAMEMQSQNFLIIIDTFTLQGNGPAYQLSLQGRVFSR